MGGVTVNQTDIENKAIDYAGELTPAYIDGYYEKYQIEQAFIDGANWALKNQWISVRDELPEDRKEVLVYDQDGSMVYTAWYNHKMGIWVSNRWLSTRYEASDEQVMVITHWMPILKPEGED